jgi:hypothetical protein
VGSGLAGEE